MEAAKLGSQGVAVADPTLGALDQRTQAEQDQQPEDKTTEQRDEQWVEPQARRPISGALRDVYDVLALLVLVVLLLTWLTALGYGVYWLLRL